MFFNLTQYNSIFVRPQKSNLILAVPLCARTVIFFCDDLTFYHYSLIDNKILYQSKLPGRPVQAISLSGHQILCTVMQSRALMLLNIKQKSFQQICRLPQTKIHNQNKQRDIFTQTKLHIFQKKQPRIEQSKTKIYYLNSPKDQKQIIKADDLITKQINTRKMVLKKLNSQSKLVLFKQDIQDNGVFKFSTVDCSKNFDQVQYVCENKAFTRFGIIREIRSISKEEEPQQMLIFVNCNGPQILIYSNNEVGQFPYKSEKIFLSTILINLQFGYGMFMFMPDPEEANPNHDHVIQLINIKTGTVLERRKLTLNQVVKSWQDDYLLLYRKQTVPSNTSSFQIHNIIGKKAFYMKMLWEKGLSDFSQRFMNQIMNCFE